MNTDTEPPNASTPAALATKNLRRQYTTRTGQSVGVAGVSIDLRPGELVALLGPNGSGKSTLIGMLATIDPPDAGQIIYDAGAITIAKGSSNTDRRRARTLLGIAFQAHILDPLLTVRENLHTAAALYSIDNPGTRIADLLNSLRIADRADDRVGTLSGGLARRADLARVLIHAPRVLLLDEPTAGLDPDARRDLLATLDQHRHHGAASPPAILMTTHLTDEADRADRVLILNRGEIIAEGTPAELRASLGERLLAVEHDPRDTEGVGQQFRSLGLEPATPTPGRTTAPLPGTSPDEIIRVLLDADLRFRVGPPDLADVYSLAIARHGSTPPENAGAA